MSDLRSLMGYSVGSPWENAPYNLIKTPQGRITMANTKKKLKAYDAKTGKFLSDLEPGKEYQFPTNEIIEMKTLKKGGLSRDTDFGSEKKPYPMVKPTDFAGGDRSYPIPTRADAIDALRLAGLHGRSDVKAKVYAKYPDLKHQEGGYFACGGSLLKKYQVGGITTPEMKTWGQPKPDPFEFKKINSSVSPCPHGYFWSAPDNDCKPIPKTTPVIQPTQTQSVQQTIPNTNPALAWMNPTSINGVVTPPPVNPDVVKPTPITPSVEFHPEEDFNNELKQAEVRQSKPTDALSEKQKRRLKFANNVVKVGNAIGSTANTLSTTLGALNFGLSAFANSVEEGRQKAWNRKQMANQFNQSYSNAQNDYGVDPYEQTGQLRPYLEYGGIHINPANKGKFTATKQRTGKTTEELTHSKNPLTRKRAIFAQNAAKWHHQQGGKFNAADFLGMNDVEDEIKTTVATEKKKSPRITEEEIDQLTAMGLSPEDILRETGEGVRNPYRGTTSGSGFQSFATPEEGAQALENQIDLHKSGKSKSGITGNEDILQYFSKYAPAVDKNNPVQYAQNIAKWTGYDINTPIKNIPTKDLAKAITRMEGNTKGNNPGNLRKFQKGGTYTVDFATMMDLQKRGIKYKLV